MDELHPPSRVVAQRVRNRLIEYFELLASPGAQDRYEAAAPVPSLPNEIMNQWEDWSPGVLRSSAGPEVYSDDEAIELAHFGAAWERAASAMTEDSPSLAEVRDLAAWRGLCAAGAHALEVFGRRGRLPEDRET